MNQMTVHDLTEKQFDFGPETAIVVGRRHLERLLDVVERHRGGPEAEAAERLDAELRRAVVVPQKRLPPEIAAIGSLVGCEDLESGARFDVILCAPEDADPRLRRISVLDPMALALLGKAESETVAWETSDGPPRRARIASVQLAG